MKSIFIISILLFPLISFSQLDTSFIKSLKALDTANSLKADTASVPQDRLTEKIKLLRSNKKGLTAEMALQMKIMEAQQKDTSHSTQYYDQLLKEVTTGKTGKLIENSLINLYRRTFTEKEIDDMILFYNTPAGKKMDKEFILLMVQSIKDAEGLLKIAATKIDVK